MTSQRVDAKGLAGRSRAVRGWFCLALAVALIVAAGAGLRGIYGQAPERPADTPPPQTVASVPSAPGNSGVALKSSPEDERKKQLAGECADLLKMATALKAEVDKSTKDELSVSVVRKAGEIEQFARKVKSGN